MKGISCMIAWEDIEVYSSTWGIHVNACESQALTWITTQKGGGLGLTIYVVSISFQLFPIIL